MNTKRFRNVKIMFLAGFVGALSLAAAMDKGTTASATWSPVVNAKASQTVSTSLKPLPAPAPSQSQASAPCPFHVPVCGL